MNTNIQQLKEVLMNDNITTVTKGIIRIDEFFDSCEFHECKEEWSSFNHKQKKLFVTQLLQTETNDEVVDVTESDIDDGFVEVTEFQQIKQNEIDGLLEQIEQYKQHIRENEQRLMELGYTNIDINESKMDRAVRVFKQNFGISRRDMLLKFQEECGLTKAGSQTYYNTIKNKIKTIVEEQQ